MQRNLKDVLRLFRSPGKQQPPRGLRAFVAPPVRVLSAAEEGPPSPPAGIRLREYQEECIQSVLSYLDKGHKRLGISLATGSGKTVIFTQLIDRLPPQNDNASQTLILVHRRELAEQAARHCLRAYPSKTIDVEMGNSHATGAADITVASVQSITSKDRIMKFDPKRFKLILVDEAHHIVAPGYMEVLSHFGLLAAPEGISPQTPALVGVSATLSRFDGLKLGAAIDHIVYHKDYVDMIGEKWLSNVIFTTVRSNVNISKVKKGATGDFQPRELSKVFNTEETNVKIVRSWLAKAGERKSTIVFCVDIAHVLSLTDMFRKQGIDARYVTGETSKTDRSERLEGFRNGSFPVLLNCGVFTEGTDIPNIDCVVLARPTRSRNLLVQMIGRGMRLHPGKENCHIIDMVASLEAGIVTTPTLFGLDPIEIVNKADVEDLKKLREQRHEEMRVQEEQSMDLANLASRTHPHSKDHTTELLFTDYDSVFDLIEDTSGERHIRAMSPLAWVQVAPEKYVLSPQSGETLIIERVMDENYYTVLERRKVPSKYWRRPSEPIYARPRIIATTERFEDAIHAADTYATGVFERTFITTNQNWRRRPATEAQVAFLNRFRDRNDPLTPATVTKGKAADMITKITNGARGRFGEIESQKRRITREALKKEQLEGLRRREEVAVGPLVG
ncbi:hypothetical protein FGG08_007371 [Glutinoglossum americanum]|uniref:Mitochondrial ATP-dependent helicase irc3 n=1 Tax=Glutinoglossum americanum TaxID=1670608 RepID=A0A9P8HUD1_9PEZI|nr:hypothetical protein FGG08_007371 [Glutinoglossum americanum]